MGKKKYKSGVKPTTIQFKIRRSTTVPHPLLYDAPTNKIVYLNFRSSSAAAHSGGPAGEQERCSGISAYDAGTNVIGCTSWL